MRKILAILTLSFVLIPTSAEACRWRILGSCRPFCCTQRHCYCSKPEKRQACCSSQAIEASSYQDFDSLQREVRNLSNQISESDKRNAEYRMDADRRIAELKAELEMLKRDKVKGE